MKELLLAEGVPEDEIAVDEYPTYTIEEDGEVVAFYTIKMEHGLPSLQHFVVKDTNRNHSVARRLVRSFREKVKEHGYGQAIIHCDHDKKRLAKLIEAYFKTKPYADAHSKWWYLVEV